MQQTHAKKDWIVLHVKNKKGTIFFPMPMKAKLVLSTKAKTFGCTK
jgi:hypothetical protein